MGEYEAGEVVQLRSGGPLMTVIGPAIRDAGAYVRPGAVYTCTWFADGMPQIDEFLACTLKRPEPYSRDVPMPRPPVEGAR